MTAKPFEVPVAQRQLFLDDHGIASTENLEHTLHTPEKKGAVIEPQLPNETSLQIRCAPAWDPVAGCYRIGSWPMAGSRSRKATTASTGTGRCCDAPSTAARRRTVWLPVGAAVT